MSRETIGWGAKRRGPSRGRGQSYSGLLLSLASDLDSDSYPKQRLDDFIGSYRMQPDVRSQVEREFWKREGLYRAIMDDVSAYQRVKDNIQHGIDFKGNITVSIRGRKRHGKSTVGRWLAQLRWLIHTGSTKDWESKVIYDQSYSGATNKIKDLAIRLWEEACSQHTDPVLRLEAFFEGIRFYLSKMDENLIEHHEDSKRAENDLRNLVRTCGVAQIDFFFLSTVSRLKEVDFELWAVGIDPINKLTLSFYYDIHGECHGYLVTPDSPETIKYSASKGEAVRDILLTGGRRPAQSKQVGRTAAAAMATPALPPISADDEFLSVLRDRTIAALQSLTPRRAPQVIRRWVSMYFDGLTAPQIKDAHQETITVRGITKSISELSDAVDTTTKGSILEHTVAAYLNLHTQRTREPGETDGSQGSAPTPQTNPKLVSDLSSPPRWRVRAGPGAPDVVLEGPEGILSAVSCKYYWGSEQQNALNCVPEHTAAPERAFLVCVERPEKPEPGQAGFTAWAARVPAGGWVRRGSLTNLRLKWSVFLDELRGIVNDQDREDV